MSIIQNLNDPLCPIWIITGEPYDNDAPNNVIFSGGYGWNFKKVWKLSGLPNIEGNIHIRSLRPCLGATYDGPTVLFKLHQEIERYKPTLIILLTDELLNYFVPNTTQIKEKNSSIRKWAGSLLKCDSLQYPHYIFACQPPDYITRNWDEHEIVGYIDLGHVKEEYDYWMDNKILNPLPRRTLITMPSYPDLLSLLHDTLTKKIIADDIETIRPRKGNTLSNSTFYAQQKHPGYPYCNAIAWDKSFAFSYSYWDYTPEQCVKIWRLTARILSEVPQIGQNYFTFDSHYHERMGFRVCLRRCFDTLIRHHILWPGLPHSLQFQTKQYTREPFYKDEGKNFRLAEKAKYMTYNCKDACVTFEIYEAQEKEFEERPHLK